MDTYGAGPVKTEPIQKGDDWVVTAWTRLSGRVANNIRPGFFAASSQAA
jgi:hypothetical protein